MRLGKALKWAFAGGVVLVATAATAQQGSNTTQAIGEINYARRNAAGANAQGSASGDLRVDQTQEAQLTPAEKKKLVDALAADIEAAYNALTPAIGNAEAKYDVELAKCLRGIQTRVGAALQKVKEGQKGDVAAPGAYAQIRQSGVAAQSALKQIKGCPVKVGAASDGTSVTTTLDQYLADEGRDDIFPAGTPPIVVLAPPMQDPEPPKPSSPVR